MHKACFRCGLVKPAEAFYRHPDMADGLLNKCKDCTRADVKANRRARHRQYADYDRARDATPGRRFLKKAYAKNHQERHPDRARARRAVRNAVRAGRLARQPCEACGSPDSQAHHEDYGRPLDVRWLCFRCHREKGHGQTVEAVGFVAGRRRGVPR